MHLDYKKSIIENIGVPKNYKQFIKWIKDKEITIGKYRIWRLSLWNEQNSYPLSPFWIIIKGSSIKFYFTQPH